MKKNLGKLALHSETLRGLDSLNRQEVGAVAGGNTENTCFQTCHCKSAYTCFWSDCGCPTSWC